LAVNRQSPNASCSSISRPSRIGLSGINVFPALKDRDFSSERLTFQPDTENVQSGVDVTVMRHTTL
jgi:hypothetical protein